MKRTFIGKRSRKSRDRDRGRGRGVIKELDRNENEVNEEER